ncbi:MAG: type I restriction endonuclease subunit R [Caldilineaceae bacterium]|nr:type I restriction endonuclease subunit R [Caldilineaceae bacterium]MBP8121280.1 type I restriction endonuclease subunit R [Caldilineaceae bacterium]MBP9070846.1 type I restriction endonuclease subunit R [Caldilineaceae bacterium]
MSPTDTSEAGLESTIISALTGLPVHYTTDAKAAKEAPVPYGGAGYVLGDPQDYDREFGVDVPKLLDFLDATQPQVMELLGLGEDGPRRRKFLARLQGEISKRGIIDVLRKGISHYPANDIRLFYGTPSAGNVLAVERYATNIFSITRQLRYSQDQTRLALDLCLFLNGLPVATFELKNRLTKQTVHDAVAQYKKDRDPRELLFQFGRCMVHFAVDDQEVRFCTALKGDASWFLPFNLGYNDGAGNPPNPHGIKTDYLWKQILTKASLTDIIENYAQVVEKKDERTGRKSKTQIWPRYHQLKVVRRLLADVRAQGVGQRYLIQHSAGSGKSNSIAWLAHQLVGLEQESQALFDSVIVVTDRLVLDKQIKDTIKQFAQVSATVGHAQRSGLLRDFLAAGKKIIITTVQKFPFILDEIGNEHRRHKFAILIDEAHSSQSGRTAAKMNIALAEGGGAEEDESFEDTINRVIESRKMLPNASYFAFTATPKNKTLEIFGVAYAEAGEAKHRAYDSYTMKQAIQEGFILDVLGSYTPVESYYRLMKTVVDDPEYDSKKAQRKLRRYVEGHEYAIRQKAEIMVDHFHDQVLARQLIGGQARAMVITGGILRAMDYYHAIETYLRARHSPYRAIVAFSGEHEYGGQKVTEASLNGFPSSQIEEQIRKDPYRFLVVADKFQTGYDEPLLHTMYVDKALSGIKAVQTLSRLNRAHPKKHSTFVLDFVNDEETIRAAFEDYYRTTILSGQTDPNKLNDLKADLDGYQVYVWPQVEQLVALYVGGAEREQLDPLLDVCVPPYLELDEDGQVDFKGKAKGFVRTYGFLAAILPIASAEWEMLATFLNFLIPKLPAPVEEDLSKGILEAIDMESYRVEVQSAITIVLADEEGEVEPVPTGGSGFLPDPELDRLSNIIRTFNDLFGNVAWSDRDKIAQVIAQEIPPKVAANQKYQNAMRHSDKQNARIEHDKVLQGVLVDLMSVQIELFKEYQDNPSFKKWLEETVFAETYVAGAPKGDTP